MAQQIKSTEGMPRLMKSVRQNNQTAKQTFLRFGPASCAWLHKHIGWPTYSLIKLTTYM